MLNEKPGLEILGKAGTSIRYISGGIEGQMTNPIRTKATPPLAPVAVDGQGESSKRAVQRPPAWALEDDEIL